MAKWEEWICSKFGSKLPRKCMRVEEREKSLDVNSWKKRANNLSEIIVTVSGVSVKIKMVEVEN